MKMVKFNKKYRGFQVHILKGDHCFSGLTEEGKLRLDKKKVAIMYPVDDPFFIKIETFERCNIHNDLCNLVRHKFLGKLNKK